MKTSTSSNVRVILGSSRNQDLIERLSYLLLRQFFELPPAKITLFDNTVSYEISPQMVEGGVPNTKYRIEIDNEGVTTECFAITKKELEYVDMLNHDERPFWFNCYTVYVSTTDTSPFKLKHNAVAYNTVVVMMKKEYQLEIDEVPVIIEAREVLLNPMTTSTEMDQSLYFHYNPLYQVEIVFPIHVDISKIPTYLHMLIPKCFFEK